MTERTTNNAPDYLTVTEAADILGVSRRTVERYMTDGHLTVLRLPANKRPRLRRAEVEALAEPTQAAS